jgi:hypothetical protein
MHKSARIGGQGATFARGAGGAPAIL